LVRRPSPTSTLFPYTTLFRSHSSIRQERRGAAGVSSFVQLAGDRERVRRGIEELDVLRGCDTLGCVEVYRAEDQHFAVREEHRRDRKSTRLNSSHLGISYAVF